MKSKFSIVVPAYNESAHIKEVIKSICDNSGLNVVVVDDGSKDNSKLKVKNLKLKNLTLLGHKVNLGKGAAMKTGAEAAFEMGAEAVIFMDADGQHDAGDLKVFIEALNEGYDVVFGSRNLSSGTPLVRYLGNKFGSALVNILFGVYVPDLLSGYRAITKEAYKKIKWESSGYGVETEMVIKTAINKLKYCEVPVAAIYLDKVKGVTVLDALNILIDVFRWKFQK